MGGPWRNPEAQDHHTEEGGSAPSGDPKVYDTEDHSDAEGGEICTVPEDRSPGWTKEVTGGGEERGV
jgi:hypothetical protein